MDARLINSSLTQTHTTETGSYVEEKRLLRVFFLPSVDLSTYITPQQGGWGGTVTCPFRLPAFALDNPGCSSWELFEWLQREHSNPHSEVAFALQWTKMETDFAARRRQLFHFFPVLNEVLQLMRLIIQCQSATTELGVECVWVLNGAGDTVLTFRRQGENRFRHMLRGGDVPPIIIAWERLLLRHFSPPTVLDEWPLCILPGIEHCVGASEVRVPLPTHHERLEARLRLREWLEHNAPQEIERLLPR